MSVRRAPPHAAAATPAHASAPRRRRPAAGCTPLPTALFVLVLFVAPAAASCCGCRARTGRCSAATRARTSPTTTTRPCSNRFFVGLGRVHPEVHGPGDVLLDRARPRPRPAGAGVDAAGRGCCAPRSWCPARSASHRRRCSSTCSTRRSPGRFADLMNTLRLSRSSARPTRALWSTLFLIVWRYAGLLHAADARRPAGHPRRRLRGRPHRRRLPLADVPPTSRSRCCGPRSRSPRCCASPVRCSRSSSSTSSPRAAPTTAPSPIVQLIYNVAFQGQNDLGVAAALSVIVLARARRHQHRAAARLPPHGRGLRTP